MQSQWVDERHPFPAPRLLPVDPAPLVLGMVALAAGIALDVGVRGGVHNGVVGAGVALTVAAVVSSRRVERAAARWLALAALVPAGFLVVRASPWLAAANVGLIVVLIGLAVSFAHSGSVGDTTPVAVVARAAAAAGRAAVGPALLRHAVPERDGRLARHGGGVARATAIAVPILAVVIALLASGDAVFRSLVIPRLHVQVMAGHVALIALFVVVVLGVAAAALGDAQPQARSGRFEAVEIIVMLGLAAGVLALFAAAQLVALSDAGDRLVAEAGLTPAEYARSGFFQLCWATLFLVGFLALARGLAAPGVYDHPAVRVLAGLVPLLALGLVVVSLRRMALYDAAFGLTMLRLWVVGAALWMGLLLVMLAMRNIGVGRTRNWLVAGAGCTAFAMIVVANIANPEAFVARHNIARAEHGRVFDADYLAQLSDDAVPVVVDAIEHSSSDNVRAALQDAFSCWSQPNGAATLNRAAHRASEARNRICSAVPDAASRA
jgi:hypothetical protein